MMEKAAIHDADELLPLLLSAIGNIAYTLSGSKDEVLTRSVLRAYIAGDNSRLSYRNIIVDRQEGVIAGMLIAYSGDKADELDKEIRERLQRLYGEEAAAAVVTECKDGDYYLDSIAVDERFRGRGIAKSLIAEFERFGRAAGFIRLSLIVEPYNDGAYSLYRKLGFVDDGLWNVSDSAYKRMIKEL
ncbi:GNAT family N-acetyltransferase [Paenibacillus sp. strain BS8-2]